LYNDRWDAKLWDTRGRFGFKTETKYDDKPEMLTKAYKKMKLRSAAKKTARHSLTTRKSAEVISCGAWILCASLFQTANVQAVGFRLPNQDPEAIARGNAFAATADNPSAIYYNPAGITQLEGQNVSAGLYLISADVKFDGAAGANAETRRQPQEVPQFYYVYSPDDFPLSFGLGVYAPYGLALKYGNVSPFADAAQDGNLEYVTVNPVVAWKITPKLSIAVGPTINYGKVDFDTGSAAGQFHFVGDDYDFGFNAGAFWHPIDQLAFGLNYRYLTTMDFKGHSSFVDIGASQTTASFRFPQNAVAGVSYRPTDKWNVEFDLDWTDWDNVNQTVFNGTPAGNIPFLFNYKSSFMYDFGVTRQLPKGYFVSAGFIYSENSSPSQNFNPIVPDSNLYLGSVGFGQRGEHWRWAVSYTLAVSPSRWVADSSYGSSVTGTYRTMNNALNASIGYKF
jgi:long-chain fatty acid transport protein